MGVSENELEYTDPSIRSGSASLAAVPPFGMRNVTCRAFPLHADVAALNAFCDSYLNMDIPPSIVQFRPALPFVYFLALDYGSMSPESIGVQNLGWVAQHEMLFMVPLQRWREIDGEMVFQDWACVSPFIFVDNPMSQRTGREVYGWPKVLGHITGNVQEWVNDPRAPTRVFDMSVHVFPKTYSGERQMPRRLVSIERAPAPRLSEIPINATNPFGLLSSVTQLGSSVVDLTESLLDMTLGLRLRGNRTNRTADNMTRMVADIAMKLVGAFPDVPWWPIDERTGPTGAVSELSIEQITLKQFRHVSKPIEACYQALVGSPMAVDRVNAGGFMGDTHLLTGDASGGYSIMVHRYESQPIIEALGLRVHDQLEDDDGSKVSVLKPVLPFWTDVDLNYGAGAALCSRVPSKDPRKPVRWIDEQPPPPAELHKDSKGDKRGGEGDKDAGDLELTDEMERIDHEGLALAEDLEQIQSEALLELSPSGPGSGIPYNTARGAATQPVSGPFHFPDMTIQVFPLLADKEAMQGCVDRYLNDILQDSGFSFEVMGSYAYLIASLCGDEEGTMWSEVNDIGWWAEREISFNIPVKWLKDGEMHSIAMVSPFVFANSGRAVLTDREVNGREAVQAKIDTDEDVWFTDPSGPVKPRNLLRVSTSVFPALNLGQRDEERVLLEIDEKDVLAYNNMVGWRLVAESWGQEIAAELNRLTSIRKDFASEVKDAKALATEILASGQSVNWINLKQYRDTACDRACYQSVVHTTWKITDVYDVREIKNRMHVHLYRYPGLPIADTLGLKVKATRSRKGGVVESYQPMRPFWMRLAICQDLGRELCWRTKYDSEWTISHPLFGGDEPFRYRGFADFGGDYGEGPSAYFSSSGYPKQTRAVRRLGKSKNWRHPKVSQRIHDTVDQELRHALWLDLSAIREQTLEDDRFLDIRDLDSFVRSQTTEELYRSVEEIIKRKPELKLSGKRIPTQRAAEAITQLDELQLVIGSILSDQWAHWGDPENEPAPPECCIRIDSVDWWEERVIWMRRHGLQDAGNGWVVPRSGMGPGPE